MSEMEVDDTKNNIQNSLLKSKSKESVTDEQGNKNKRVVFQEKPIILNKVSQKTPEPVTKSDSTENEKKEKKERNRPPTKVVVRRLPPTMTLESFIDNVSPVPEHDYIYFVQADLSLGPNAFSRAYINFVNMDDLLTFYEQFDNYVFMDSKGNEYPAVVEFAPFQRVPKKRPGRKKDPKIGTLKEDPAFISFVASLKEKKDTSSVKQASAEHLLALTSENSSKKNDVTTPLLEFIKQRRAERQRVREEKREERKRKELERKRIKEEERKRRKDSDSVLKVLRNPEHEEKDDPGKNGKDRERNQQMMKKREEERKHREKERKEKRDLKGRDGPPKNFRDDRQKPMDGRMPRKVLDEQRRKPGMERSQVQNKTLDVRHGSEFEKSSHTKDSDTRKNQGYGKDGDQKKGPADKFQSHSKDSDRYSREQDGKKNYKDNDVKKSEKPQPFMKDSDYKRGSYESRRNSHSFSEGDTRRKFTDHKNNVKGGDTVQEAKTETTKSQNSEETEVKKWELLGAKPKRIISEEGMSAENDGHKTSDGNVKKEDSASDEITDNPTHSAESKENEMERPDGNKREDLKTDIVPGVILKRRSSLESDSQTTKKTFEAKPRRQTSLDSDMFFKNVCDSNSPKAIILSRSQEFANKMDTIHVARRSSLDSGDHKKQSLAQERGDLCGSNSKFQSDVMDGDSEKKCATDTGPMGDSKTEAAGAKSDSEKNEDDRKFHDQSSSEEQKSERSRNEAQKYDDANKILDGCSSEGNKRDPRAERRIRNKDRPSIEIYRPGMGRFSMQRKEREKNAAINSSTEQDSPSNSPSPSPSGRLLSSSKVAKSSQELRSMTFKRSVSREK